MRKQILYYAVKYQGEYSKIKQAIQKDEKWEDLAYDGNYVTIIDDHYPKQLYDLYDPPFILFYEGNYSLLNQMMICVIGSRDCSILANYSTQEFIESLNKDVVIISGLARGIDTLAHQKAILMNHATIGVVGCGLDIVYPKSNEKLYQEMKKNHLILSEYPSGIQPLAHHFPMRNRILAALAYKVVIIEAKRRSGTMITAGVANDLNREIIAFPYRYDDEFGQGCNELIELGASIFMKKDEKS